MKSFKKNELVKNHGREKRDYFNIPKISYLFNLSDETDVYQKISKRTYHDLDLEEVFMFLDRTSSKIGQQVLYNFIRTIPNSKNRANRLESLIKKLHENDELKRKLILSISQLNNPTAYNLISLLKGQKLVRPKWYWLLPTLFFLSILFIFLTFIYPIFFIGVIVVFSANAIIHYWNRNNIFKYSNVIPDLITLKNIGSKIFDSSLRPQEEKGIKKAIDTIKGFQGKAFIFKIERILNGDVSDLGSYIVDLIKIIFLIEPLFLFAILKKVENEKKNILKLYHFVGEVDVALSTEVLRKKISKYCFPEFTNSRELKFKGLTHPLILEPVSNSLKIPEDKSILLSGSNMSGKTTFIRTIGLNVLLAQTINMVLADKFVMPHKVRCYSTIKMEDSLLDDVSYYQQEVITIKELIDRSEEQEINMFLLDELFKGTNTIERVASGKAVLSYLTQNNNFVIVSTHDLELTEYLKESYNYYHFAEMLVDDQLKFDYKLREGKLTHTNAIRILELNNLPREVTEEARKISGEMIQRNHFKLPNQS